MLSVETIAGRDAYLPVWQKNSPRPNACGYDSAAISGNGIGAAVMAAALNRSPEFQGKVTIVSPPVQESRRLINGVTLRARAIDYYAAALGLTRNDVLREIYGEAWRQAETDLQFGIMCGGADQDYAIKRQACWMDGRDVRPDRTENAPLAYGVRNSRLAGALMSLARQAGVRFVDEDAHDFEALKAHAVGQNPIIINAKPKPLGSAETAWNAPTPTSFVAASQVTFTDVHRETRGVLSQQASLCAFVHRDSILDMAVYYPFQDPLSPEATYYGIFYRVLKADAYDKAHELSCLTDELTGVGEQIGLTVHDADDTMGQAVVPCLRWRGLQNRQKDVLDLAYIYSGGAPIITGDGMVRSAIGATAAADAILNGRDPVPEINRALRLYRFMNWAQCLAMTRYASATARILGWRPDFGLAGPGKSRDWDMWAGAY